MLVDTTSSTYKDTYDASRPIIGIDMYVPNPFRPSHTSQKHPANPSQVAPVPQQYTLSSPAPSGPHGASSQRNSTPSRTPLPRAT